MKKPKTPIYKVKPLKAKRLKAKMPKVKIKSSVSKWKY